MTGKMGPQGEQEGNLYLMQYEEILFSFFFHLLFSLFILLWFFILFLHHLWLPKRQVNSVSGDKTLDLPPLKDTQGYFS